MKSFHVLFLMGFFAFAGIQKINAATKGLQQTDTQITGTVTSSTGPLGGVSVTVKEAGFLGTVTDGEGKYSINANKGNTLVFSHAGYTTQEITVGSSSVIDVVLLDDVQSMGEVIVVGYGTQTREKLIGSVAQVSGEQIAERPVSQLKLALTGQLPGVIITQRNGSPGVGSGRISVRGVGSFGASPDALILVDGIIVNNFNDIDPNDVETISVLKDASSAAIYGARAANGVILVTTKTGKEGPPKVSLHSYVGTQRPTSLPDIVNSWEYQQAYFEAENYETNGTAALTPEQLEEVEKYRAQNDPEYPNIRYLDAVLSKNGVQTGHNVSVRGGSAMSKYNLSIGYLHQDGLVERNNYSRYNTRLNMTTNLNSKLSATIGLAATAGNVNEPMGPASGVAGSMLTMIEQAVRFPPTFAAQNPNGEWGIGLGSGTPISDLATPSFSKEKTLNLNGNLRIDYNVIKDLKLSFIGGYRRNENKSKNFRAKNLLPNITAPNFLNQSASSNEYYTLQGLANYSKQWGEHHITALAGYSFEDYYQEGLSGYREGFPSDDLTVLAAGGLTNQTTGGNASEYALESQFGRLNYSYDNKYLLEGVVRRDGSSRFPSHKKYAVFPSVAAGWRIGQENFILDGAPWISELKIKASWGILGNQDIGDYPYQNTLSSSNANDGGTSYPFGGVVYPGFARTNIVDSNLHWESTRNTDFGIEVGFLKNKIMASATYFNRYSYAILVSPGSVVSNVLGFGLSQFNNGELLNRGWEFTAGYNERFGKFGLNLNGNLTILKNEVLDLGVGNRELPNGMVGNGSDLFIGYPAGRGGGYDLFYGYVADGLFISEEDITEYETTNNQEEVNPSPLPGDIRYKDISGPDGVPDGVVDATYDRVVLGSQIPKYSYGVNIGARYGQLDLGILLQGIAKVTGRLQEYAAWGLYQNTGNIQRWQYDGRWTEANPDRNAAYPRIENIPGGGLPNTVLSSFWTLNGSYLRIKNVQLGYALSQNALKKTGLTAARIYLSGENLHTFSNYQKGWDPEINGTGNFYPILSTYTLGFNITF